MSVDQQIRSVLEQTREDVPALVQHKVAQLRGLIWFDGGRAYPGGFTCPGCSGSPEIDFTV
jgi:hypothetical protein